MVIVKTIFAALAVVISLAVLTMAFSMGYAYIHNIGADKSSRLAAVGLSLVLTNPLSLLSG
jgi:hypothetical protein